MSEDPSRTFRPVRPRGTPRVLDDRTPSSDTTPPLTMQQQAWFDAYTLGSHLDRNTRMVEGWLEDLGLADDI